MTIPGDPHDVTVAVAACLGRAVAAIGTAAGGSEYTQAMDLTVVVFFAHVGLRPLSAWI